MIDTTINIGNLLTIFIVGSGLIATFVTVRNTVTSLNREVLALQKGIEKLTDVMVSQARQEERLTAMDQRMLLQGQRIDETRKSVERLQEGRFDMLIDKFNHMMTTMEKQ